MLKAARRRITDRDRHNKMRDANALTLEILAREVANESLHSAEASAIPDERLKLLFVCAHPAIEPDMRTPLMLRTVLELDARPDRPCIPRPTVDHEPTTGASEDQDQPRRNRL